MHKINLFFLVLISLIAICVNCYAGYGLFLMTVMAYGADFPLLYFSTVVLTLVLFIASIIGLFYLKRWARNIFVSITLFLSWGLLDVYLFQLRSKYIKLGIWLVLFIVFIPVFVIYFLLPSTRRLFGSKVR